MRATALGTVRREALGIGSSEAASPTQRSQDEGSAGLPLLLLPECLLHMVVCAVEAGGGVRLAGGEVAPPPLAGNPLLPLRAVCRLLREVVDAHVSSLTLEVKGEGPLPTPELARLEHQLHSLLPRWPRLQHLTLSAEHSSTTDTTSAIVSAAAAACPDLPSLTLLPNRTYERPLAPFPLRSLSAFRALRRLSVHSHGRDSSLDFTTGIELSQALPLLEDLELLEGKQRPCSDLPEWKGLGDCFDEQMYLIRVVPDFTFACPVFDLANLDTATNLQRLRILRHDIPVLRLPRSLRALELCSLQLLGDVEAFDGPSLTRLELRSITASGSAILPPPLPFRNVVNQLAMQPRLTSLALEHVEFDVATLSRGCRGLKLLELIHIKHRNLSELTVLPAILSEGLTRLVIWDPMLDLATAQQLMWDPATGVPSSGGPQKLTELKYVHLDLRVDLWPTCAWRLKEPCALSSLEHLCVRELPEAPTFPREPVAGIPPLQFLERLMLLDLEEPLDIQNLALPLSLTSLVLSKCSFEWISGKMFRNLKSLLINLLEGTERIQGLEGLPQLRQLGLKYCRDDGELHLKDLPRLKFLQLGYVRPSKVVLSRVPLLNKSNMHNVDIVDL